MDGHNLAAKRGVRTHARPNQYPHPATALPHFVVVAVPTHLSRWHRAAADWLSRTWPAFDLVLWACVVAIAGMDILTTTVGLQAGLADEGNRVGAAAYDWGGPMGLLQLKLLALFAIIVLWVVVPWRWRSYVRAGTMAGGTVTFAATAHNALLLLRV